MHLLPAAARYQLPLRCHQGVGIRSVMFGEIEIDLDFGDLSPWCGKGELIGGLQSYHPIGSAAL